MSSTPVKHSCMEDVFRMPDQAGSMNAIPCKHFAFPPYSAHPSGGKNDWWYVANSQGFNCLTFPDNPGAVFTSEVVARALVEKWNADPPFSSGSPPASYMRYRP